MHTLQSHTPSPHTPQGVCDQGASGSRGGRGRGGGGEGGAEEEVVEEEDEIDEEVPPEWWAAMVGDRGGGTQLERATALSNTSNMSSNIRSHISSNGTFENMGSLPEAAVLANSSDLSSRADNASDSLSAAGVP